jgi:hypothetical protein
VAQTIRTVGGDIDLENRLLAGGCDRIDREAKQRKVLGDKGLAVRGEFSRQDRAFSSNTFSVVILRTSDDDLLFAKAKAVLRRSE